MKLEIKAQSELTALEWATIRSSFIPIFAGDASGLEWSPVDWHVLVWEGNALASHVEIVERNGTVDEQPVILGGIGGVATLPAWRRRGLAAAALQAAAEFMRNDLQVDFGLLICGQGMIPYYQRLGWQLVPGPMVFDQPGGQITFHDPVMVLPCRKEEWPDGIIDLCGLPW